MLLLALALSMTNVDALARANKRHRVRRELPPRGRPQLQLGFEAEVLVERALALESREVLVEHHHFAADEDQLKVAVVSTNHSGHDRGSVIIDVGKGVRIDSEPFFDELVCFQFDLGLATPPPNAASDSDDAPDSEEEAAAAARAAFGALVGEALGAPLALYEVAEETPGGPVHVLGAACRAYIADQRAELPLPPRPELEAIAQELDLSQALLSKLLRADGGVLALRATATFCVDENGLLHAANASRSMALLGPGNHSEVLRSEASRTLLRRVRPLDDSTTIFSPHLRAAGGRCVDLTSGAAERTEMRGMINDGHRLARINREARGEWRAAPYDWLHGLSVADVRLSLGTSLRPLRLSLRRAARPCTEAFGQGCRFAIALGAAPPEDFDARRQWGACKSIGAVRNQGQCGSCWAVAAASVLADRFCIAAQQANVTKFANLSLSPQYMLDCTDSSGGCTGGHLDDAWEFLRDHGAPAESCDPYAYCPDPADPQCGLAGARRVEALPGATSEQDRTCPEQCSRQTFRAGHIYAVSLPGDVEAIQQEMLAHGPVEAAFYVFSDFHSYRKGTYFRTPSAVGPLGGHAVRLVGWGVDKHQTDYWLVANSFGRKWGMDGFFRIRRGTNECGIETMPAAGLPRLPAGPADGHSHT